MVVAQTGKRLADGTLSQVVDSPAVQITADVTGSRWINAMNALRTVPTGTDANVVSIVQESGVFTGLANSGRPTLQTAGNFTADAGDIYRLDGLFEGDRAHGQVDRRLSGGPGRRRRTIAAEWGGGRRPHQLHRR